MNENADAECTDLAGDAFDIIRTIKDPEKVETLEELCVVREEFVTVSRGCHGDNSFEINVEFAPTVPHCTLASLIGLCIRVKLHENLLCNYKLRINIQKGTHETEDEITKQINDKERVAAAMENPELLKIIKTCITDPL